MRTAGSHLISDVIQCIYILDSTLKLLVNFRGRREESLMAKYDGVILFYSFFLSYLIVGSLFYVLEAKMWDSFVCYTVCVLHTCIVSGNKGLFSLLQDPCFEYMHKKRQ